MRSNTGNSSSGSENEQVVVVELGLNLQNQDPSFLCNQKKESSPAVDDGDGDGDGDKGPTCSVYPTLMKSDADLIRVHSNSNAPVGLVKGLQPFDSCYYPSVYPSYNPSGGMSTATTGFPFTSAQWKELERQAMIYKYMVASLPVPSDLLYSSFPTALSHPSTFAPTSYFVGKYGNGLNLRWVGNSKDAEPGRCRRTDGKKWRCSRDVAFNQKYCERHMHRGRPRSRKPVELHHNSSLSDFTTTNNKIKNPNPNTKKTRLSDDSNIQPVVSSSVSKASTFDHPFEDSRSLSWAEEQQQQQQQWQHLVQQTNLNPSLFQQQFDGGVALNLNSDYGYNPKSETGLLERPLIDAWPMGLAAEHKDTYVSNNNAFDENMCKIHMGLGVMDSPGGPLAEVLRPGSVEFLTPPATAVSSPSGVLQKPHCSFSDSSGNSTPTYQNCKAKSEVVFPWLS